MAEQQLDPRQRAEALRAEADADGGVATLAAAAAAATITVSLSNDGGYIGLNWNNTGAIGRWDYVALFDTPPTDPLGYLTRQWTYVESPSGTYQTGTDALGTQGPSYWIAYCGWDYSKKAYVIVQTGGPSQP